MPDLITIDDDVDLVIEGSRWQLETPDVTLVLTEDQAVKLAQMISSRTVLHTTPDPVELGIEQTALQR